jgi:hypothetical protein
VWRENGADRWQNGANDVFVKSSYHDPVAFLRIGDEKCILCSRRAKCAKTRFKSKTGKPGFGHFWKNTILPFFI